MAYEVTARKWRPQEFDGVIGQEHVTTTLKNAIQAGQIAHAYLFAGPRGVGKTTTARILAKALNCVSGPTVTPCNTCTFCREISEGRSVDVLEIDGASNNRVEQVRTHLLESVKYTASQGKHKIYIIDEVHMLTREAFNALLKTLEEPPPHVYFIFATTDPRKVIPTVLSRCQRFDFRRISGPTIVDHLAMISEKSGYDVQREALALIARRVDGSMRDAESLLDQVVAFGGTGLSAREAAEVLGMVDQDVYFDLLDAVADQDVPGGLDLVDRIFRQGHDLEEITLGILEHLRNLLVVKAAPEVEALIGDAALELDRYREQVGRFETEDLLRLSQLATGMEQSIKSSALPRVQLETGIVRMIRMARSVQLTDVMTRLSEMARRVEGAEGDEGTSETAGTAEEAAPSAGAGDERDARESVRSDDLPATEQHAPEQHAPKDAPKDAAGSAPSAGKPAETPSSRAAAPTAGTAPAPSSGTAPAPSSETAPTQSSRAPTPSPGTSPAPASGTSPAPATEEDRSPAATADSSTTAAATAPKVDLRTARARWPDIVKELTRQRGVLGRQLEEAEITGCSPAEDGGSGSPATITLGFGPGQVFIKERAEKRDNAALIQSVCAKVLGIPVRIACVIGDRAAVGDAPVDDAPVDDAPVDDAPVDDAPVDDAMPGAEDAAPGTGYDNGGSAGGVKNDDSTGTSPDRAGTDTSGSADAGPNSAGTTGGGTDNDSGETADAGTAGVSAGTSNAGAGTADAGTAGDSAGTAGAGTDEAGPGMDPYSRAAEDPVGDEREARTVGGEREARTVGGEEGTRTGGETGGQAADARAGASKDPAVMKIVKAFDGRIVAD